MTRSPAGPIVARVMSSGGRPHSPAVLAWHGLCALGMVAMVLPAPAWEPRAAVVLFAAGVLWCGVRARRGGDRAAYLGLGVCCLAMVVMLVPALDWVAATAGAGMPVGHAGMRRPSTAGLPTAHASVPTALLVVLALALAVLCLRGVVHVAASVRRRSRPVGLERGFEGGLEGALEGVLEALLAGTMAAMLVLP